MRAAIVDIEANGTDDATHTWCVSWILFVDGEWIPQPTVTTEEGMIKILQSLDLVIGHSFIEYDKPTLERILGVKFTFHVYDTLAISRYLYPNRKKHGLADYGEEFGYPKVKIDDSEWKGVPLGVPDYERKVKEHLARMVHRCEVDTVINLMVWQKIWDDLIQLYDTPEEARHLINYLGLNMYILHLQSKYRWKLDVKKCEEGLKRLSILKDEKVLELKHMMPEIVDKKRFYKPAKGRKKLTAKQIKEGQEKGDLTIAGKKWNDYLADDYEVYYDEKELNAEGQPRAYIEYIGQTKEPNPDSPAQIKAYLYSLGWKPQTYKVEKNKETGEERKIEQVRIDKGGEKVLCKSVQALFELVPRLNVLEGISVLKHRIGLLKSFLKHVDDEGYIKAGASGFAATLRLKHRAPFVNLPGVDKPYGELIRGCLIAPEGYELCGSDQSSLEDRTKQHFMWDYDPEYVKQMLAPDFDPHLELAFVAEMLTRAQVDAHKQGTEDHSGVRKTAKVGNYSLTYGAAPKTVAKSAGITLKKAKALHAGYHKLNWSIQAIADDCKVKKCLGGRWLYNPVSKIWYSLRSDFKRFSLLNQGTGSYLFVRWIEEILRLDPEIMIVGQAHDKLCCA